MDSVTLLTLYGLPILWGIIALFITRALSPYAHGYIQIKGRINRLQFAIGIILVSICMHLLGLAVDNLMADVVILPAYYGIKAMNWIGTIILLPFYYTLYVRRLNDMGVPGFPIGIILPILIIMADGFSAIKNLNFAFTGAILLVDILLIIIPGASKKNRYGPPSHWPPVQK